MPTNNNITKALLKQFESHRIVFWYDDKKELRSEFDALNLPGVEKIVLMNNEFGVKYRILREQPKEKFLLYREGPAPEPLNNWLLDVQLAHTEFKADQAGLWLSELGLGPEMASVVREHATFYHATKRRNALKKLINGHPDTEGMIRLKMLAVCVGADPRLDHILELLLAELAEKKEDKIKLIIRCNLNDFLWEQLRRCYGYNSSVPGIEDFAIELFKSCYAKGTHGQVTLNDDALVFLKRWKDSRRFSTSFETLSGAYAILLNIESDLNERDYRDLLEIDYFELVDRKIIVDLIRAVENRTISVGDCTLAIRQRRQSYWINQFSDLYEAIDAASQFLQVLSEASLEMSSLQEGVTRYCSAWFRIDQLYRRFIYHLRQSGEASLLTSLAEQVENQYSTNYLLKLSHQWQLFVDNAQRWVIPGLILQAQFFKTWIRPFLKKNKKVFVIISDALRYETGDELLHLIRKEDRYDAEIKPVVSMLPSYTQLGMAALLPHKSLELSEKNGATKVYVDGQSSQGTVNRSKILNANDQWIGKAITAEELIHMPREGDKGYRTLFREHDLVYIYHNRIDAVGDKRDSEERVFEATRKALDELVKMIRKLSSANVTNMIVTADHGFLYQNQPIDESDFSGAEPEGEEILSRDRRFVLGKGLVENSSFKKFSSADVGLVGDVEMLFPKSIARLRLKGSGSRFVHGGTSLQEVVIPVIEINKKRKSDLGLVEINILPVGSSVITSGQMAVALYQTTPVSEKIQPRTLTAGLYSSDGKLISDICELCFDLTSENPRERELKVRLILTHEADKANGQDVYLKLMEQVKQTSHLAEYKVLRFTLRRSFTSDFDL